MPTYEYRCAECGRFEKVQPITADPLKECPTCGSPVERLISRNVNILFKGSGFHITDYRGSDYKRDADGSGAKGGQSGDSAGAKSTGSGAAATGQSSGSATSSSASNSTSTSPSSGSSGPKAKGAS